jgi:hypothetical protein
MITKITLNELIKKNTPLIDKINEIIDYINKTEKPKQYENIFKPTECKCPHCNGSGVIRNIFIPADNDELNKLKYKLEKTRYRILNETIKILDETI